MPSGIPPQSSLSEALSSSTSALESIPPSLLAQNSALFSSGSGCQPIKHEMDLPPAQRLAAQLSCMPQRAEQELSVDVASGISTSRLISQYVNWGRIPLESSITGIPSCHPSHVVNSEEVELHRGTNDPTMARTQDFIAQDSLPLQFAQLHPQTVSPFGPDGSSRAMDDVNSLLRVGVSNTASPKWAKSPLSVAPAGSSLGLFIPTEDETGISALLHQTLDGADAQTLAFRQANDSRTTQLTAGTGNGMAGWSRSHACHQRLQESNPVDKADLSFISDPTALLASWTDTSLWSHLDRHTERQIVDYGRSLSQSHSDRLGDQEGLPHPLSATTQLNPTASMLSESSQFGNGLQARPLDAVIPQTLNVFSSTASLQKAKQVLPLSPSSQEPSSAVVFVLDHEDTILWVSDLSHACMSTFLNGEDDSLNFSSRGLPLATNISGVQPSKFSHLLWDEQAVRCWQQACREVLFARHQLQRSPRQTFKGDKSSGTSIGCRKDLLLRWRSRQGGEAWIEIALYATKVQSQQDQACLLVNAKPACIPTIANATSPPLWTSSDTHTHATAPLPAPNCAPMNAGPGRAEMRLLVSRYGLILRVTCSLQPIGSSNKEDPYGRDADTRATFAILGDGVSMPEFGQNLVDLPRLSSLLHVIAQAAVIGLAQTVKLSVGGRQTTAVVQPVLRSSAGSRSDLQQSSVPAAKVWITLSAAPSTMRCPKSSPSLFSKRSCRSFPTFVGLAPPPRTESKLPGSLDRRHSVQTLKEQSRSSPPSFPPMMPFQDGRRASTTSLCVYARRAQASTARRKYRQALGDDSSINLAETTVHHYGEGCAKPSVPLTDHLNSLMAEAQAENRILRQEVEKRLRRRESQSQPDLQGYSQPRSHTLTPQPYSPQRSSNTTSNSCPTRLMHLS